jgi:uncharacterized protein YuzE
MNEIIEVATTVFQSIKPDSKVKINYDDEEDVLYINFPNSPAQKADFGRRFGDYIVRVKHGFIIGVTILDAKKHLKKNFSDKPPILTKPMIVKVA